MSNEIFVANESAVLFADGEQYVVHKNKTRVRAGHPLLKRNAHLFKALDVDLDVEDATARPGQKRGGRRRQDKPEEAKPEAAAKKPEADKD